MTNEQTRGAGCARFFVRDGRLRSGWRVLIYLILFLVFQVGMVMAIGIAAEIVLVNQGVPFDQITPQIFALMYDPSLPIALGIRVLTTALTLVFIWLFRRFIDRRSFRSLGFQLAPGWWREALAGFCFSILGWAIIFAISIGLGAATIVGLAWESKNLLAVLGAFGMGLLYNILVGISEEADARGYVLQNLAEGIRLWPAIIVSSAYFGVLHLLNPGASLTSTLGLFFAGVLLALGYYATGRLWFSIGMHAAWNWAEGPLFGFPVSGLDMGGLFKLKITGADWLIGGEFGPEAGALAIAVEIGMIVALWVWAQRYKSAQIES